MVHFVSICYSQISQVLTKIISPNFLLLPFHSFYSLLYYLQTETLQLDHLWIFQFLVKISGKLMVFIYLVLVLYLL